MKNYAFFLTLFFATTLFISCSKDDGDSKGSYSKVPDGVPQGEIVSESERSRVLTGFDSANVEANSNISSRGTTDSQVKWKYDYGEIYTTGSDCPEEEEYDEYIDEDFYISFMPNGDLVYTYDDGSPEETRQWSWADGKKGIYLDGNDEIILYFSVLNESQVAYYSKQTQGNCSLISYEVLSK